MKEATIYINEISFKLNGGFIPEFMEMNPQLKLKEFRTEYPKECVVPSKVDVHFEVIR